MYLMIDNYDSFVHNLASYFRELGQEIELVRNDKVSLSYIYDLYRSGKLEGLIISPGPKSPADCGQCMEVLLHFAGRVPILGICLGHQIIGSFWGAAVTKDKPTHGKLSRITHNRRGLFTNLPEGYKVTRYHSLAVQKEGFPSCLSIDAETSDGTIMALSHKSLPVYGIQFHPEAVLTEYGHALLSNYIRLCKEWSHEYNCLSTAAV